MKLLQNRDESLRMPNTSGGSLFFESQFFHSLRLLSRAYKYENASGWTRGIDVFKMDKLLFPINVDDMHWALVVIYPQKKEIHLFDSLAFAADGLMDSLW